MLNRKKSRPIVVDGKQYRWVVAPGNGFVVFVAESADKSGGKIEVYVESDIDQMWVEFPHIQNPKLKVVKPKDAESIIRQAIEAGWDPEVKGSPYQFEYTHDGSIVPR